jgi:hypothetical protein
MCDDSAPTSFADAGRILLNSRFAQIQGAKPASSPYGARTEVDQSARKEKLTELR